MTASCVCGSGAASSRCCDPVLAGRPAPTAERLMRSRYAGFVRGDVDHLRASWHPSTRPEVVALDPDVRWDGLTIVRTERGDLLDTDGVVEFLARCTRVSGPAELHEVSRFRREGRDWFYLDGLHP